MPQKQWTPEERKAFGDKMRAIREAKLKQTPQTLQTEAAAPQVDAPAQPTPPEPASSAPAVPAGGNVTLTAEQFNALLGALSGAQTPSTPNSFGGMQTNSRGQVVGNVIKYDIDTKRYPDPTDRLTAYFESEPRLRRLGFAENYYLKWEITTKPYENKEKLMVREPTFHMTLYRPLIDEQGGDTGRFQHISSMFLNEDENEAMNWAAQAGIEVSEENFATIMDEARYERIKRWLLAIFFPENTTTTSSSFNEEAIGGTVVKVVTKSSVVGYDPRPIISTDELG